MLAALSERGDVHTQQHLQRWRIDDIWLDREPGEREMVPRLRALAAAGALMLVVSDDETAFAEKSGGILKIADPGLACRHSKPEYSVPLPQPNPNAAAPVDPAVCPDRPFLGRERRA